MEFKFKYVNEEQFMKVMKKVQRERWCKKDATDFLLLPSKKRSANFPKEERPQREEGEVEECNDSKKVGDIVGKECVTCYHDSCPKSASVRNEAKEKNRERVNALVIRLSNVRRNILSSLDELILHHERITKKDNYFQDSEERLDESVDAKIRNCLCMVIKQEFQFVVNLRRLSLNASRRNMTTHLKALLDCYIIAWKILEIFVRGAPHVLKIDKSKEKLSGLLERMIALSSVCKLFFVEHNDIISCKDFLMDDVDRKIVSLLVSGEKRTNLVSKCYEGEVIAGLEQKCVLCGVNTMTNDTMPNVERHISIRTLKKLTDPVFGSKEKSTNAIKKRKSRYGKYGFTSTKNSQNKPQTLKGENKISANKITSDPLNELEKHIYYDNIRPQLCRDTSLRETAIGSESKCEIAKDTDNLTEEVNENVEPKDKETKIISSGIHDHLPGIIENSVNSQQCNIKLQQNDACNEVSKSNNTTTTTVSKNNEQQHGMSSPNDNSKLLDVITMSNTARSVSDVLIGECLRQVGCEVDSFVEDFVQKMFSLEFT